ncbi:hypothetical protein [Flammeovirga aprica]|uniref:Uncharacterized protein n=1 Tax=Flammeovirga aprica JL-4 TaxID=694437 RepID=A0A7X9P311_9BACT|nr:hypothetical protein [Flammeovirga aprica]NME68633.1 hypothetical protein [Flammeovirga aprica JL-4]
MEKLTLNQMEDFKGGSCTSQMWYYLQTGRISRGQWYAYMDLVYAGYNMVC